MHPLNRSAAARKDFPSAERIPYAAHVSGQVVRTSFGDYLQTFRLGGIGFETSDDEDLNNWHERLNVLWRNIAAPSVALWTHVIRRAAPVAGRPSKREAAERAVVGKDKYFADRLYASYQQRIGCETLMQSVLSASVYENGFFPC